MGTSANIIVEREDGVWESVTVNYDGYPSHTLNILENHYNDLSKVNALIALGNMSQIQKSIERPEGHTWSDPAEGCSVFYGRDRGEPEMESYKSGDLDDHHWESHAYMFTLDDEWVAL